MGVKVDLFSLIPTLSRQIKVARLVKWYNLRLPREGPGFDSPTAHSFLGFLFKSYMSVETGERIVFAVTYKRESKRYSGAIRQRGYM